MSVPPGSSPQPLRPQRPLRPRKQRVRRWAAPLGRPRWVVHRCCPLPAEGRLPPAARVAAAPTAPGGACEPGARGMRRRAVTHRQNWVAEKCRGRHCGRVARCHVKFGARLDWILCALRQQRQRSGDSSGGWPPRCKRTCLVVLDLANEHNGCLELPQGSWRRHDSTLKFLRLKPRHEHRDAAAGSAASGGADAVRASGGEGPGADTHRSPWTALSTGLRNICRLLTLCVACEREAVRAPTRQGPMRLSVRSWGRARRTRRAGSSTVSPGLTAPESTVPVSTVPFPFTAKQWSNT